MCGIAAHTFPPAFPPLRPHPSQTARLRRYNRRIDQQLGRGALPRKTRGSGQDAPFSRKALRASRLNVERASATSLVISRYLNGAVAINRRHALLARLDLWES